MEMDGANHTVSAINEQTSEEWEWERSGPWGRRVDKPPASLAVSRAGRALVLAYSAFASSKETMTMSRLQSLVSPWQRALK
jgi:hypothetical protein